MQFDNREIRRQDRLLAEPQARTLLEKGEYGVLSMLSEEGCPYGIPINYVWDSDTHIYLHCAPEGRKLRSIRYLTDVSFCVVGRTNVLADRFTTEYESIVLQCRATLGLTPEERMQALELLLDKYSPQDKVVGLKYAEKSFHRTEVIRLEIVSASGKCKRVILQP